MQYATMSLTDSEVKWLINSLLNVFTFKQWMLILNCAQTESTAVHKSASLKPHSRTQNNGRHYRHWCVSCCVVSKRCNTMLYIWVGYLMDHPLQTSPCFMALLIYLRDTKVLASSISRSKTVPTAVHRGIQMEMELEITSCDIMTVQRAVYNPPAVAPGHKSNWQYGALWLPSPLTPQAASDCQVTSNRSRHKASRHLLANDTRHRFLLRQNRSPCATGGQMF
jgi:hypothetical protein